MTARRWRFIAFVVCGLVWLAAAYLLITTNWDLRCVDGSTGGFMDSCPSSFTTVGDGLGGRIGFDVLVGVGLVAFLGAVVAAAVEVHVRNRTVRRPWRGGFWSTRP